MGIIRQGRLTVRNKNVKCVVIRVCFDEPVEAPAEHVVQVSSLVRHIVSYEKL